MKFRRSDPRFTRQILKPPLFRAGLFSFIIPLILCASSCKSLPHHNLPVEITPNVTTDIIEKFEIGEYNGEMGYRISSPTKTWNLPPIRKDIKPTSIVLTNSEVKNLRVATEIGGGAEDPRILFAIRNDCLLVYSMSFQIITDERGGNFSFLMGVEDISRDGVSLRGLEKIVPWKDVRLVHVGTYK